MGREQELIKKNPNNPHNLNIGDEIMLRHKPSNGKWGKGKITRFTSMGYAFFESTDNNITNGIVTDENEIKPVGDVSTIETYSNEQVKKLLEISLDYVEFKHNIKINEETRKKILDF